MLAEFEHKKKQILSSPENGYGFRIIQNPVWSLEDILDATGGELLAGGENCRFRSISTDSRAVKPGDLFLALSGDRFDGMEFVGDAIKRGASGVVVSRKAVSAGPVPQVGVKDTLKALGDLAQYRRNIMPDLKVVAVTGSSGKTTVKEMTASILTRKHQVLKTKGNFNNLVGLPLSLLPVDYRHDAAVLEMGMNKPGEIARLTEIADPDVACIVNVQESHLLGLGTIENVARAKGELFAGMKSWGKLAVNIDDKRVAALADVCLQEKITFGRAPGADVRATHIMLKGDNGMAFTLHVSGKKKRCRIAALGIHNVLNSLAAAAVSYASGMDIHDIAAGLEVFRPYEKRLQIERLKDGPSIVNDTYNANPSSMLAALEAVMAVKKEGRSAAVLGDMLELGEQGEKAHRETGERVARLGFDFFAAIGDFAPSYIAGALKAGMNKERILLAQDKDEAVRWIRGKISEGLIAGGDWVLVKGSRGMRMETVVESLIENTGEN